MIDINPTNQVALALAKHEIRAEFPTSCLIEARDHLNNSKLVDKSLTDWRDVPFVTIDNPDSKDLDQALVIERNDEGYRLRYALADASYYVSPGSALFAEALLRGTTYYTPTGAIPMLPTELSEGLISLNPNVDRRALVFDIRLNKYAVVVNTSVVRASIHSHAKLNYGQVQQYLEATLAGNQHELSSEPFKQSLLLFKELGLLLLQQSLDRNVIPFNRKESQIYASGGKLLSRVRERFDTEKFNEQLSLLCNMQGAQMLDTMITNSDLQAVYRVHDAPLRQMQRRLSDIINAFADVQEDKDRWLWKNGQTLSDYVTSLPSGADYTRRVAAIERQILVSNRASYFTHESGEHHALAADSYARFSSPMREVVGIYTHKELLEALSIADESAGDPAIDETLRNEVIASANRSRKTQKSLRKTIELQAIKTLFNDDLNKQPRPRYSGTIMGFKKDQLFVSLDDFATDIKVYRFDLESHHQTAYTFSNIRAIPYNLQRPQWQLGDAIGLSVDSFDPQRQRFVLNLEPLAQTYIEPS
ncbi:MAG: RNB domain-containing ribonuclease [Granulosicoccaceae bacterium]